MHASTVPLGRRGFADRDVARHHGNAGPGDDQPDGRGVGLWDAALPRLPAWHRRRNRGGAARGRDGDHGGPPRRPGGAAGADRRRRRLIVWLAYHIATAPPLSDRRGEPAAPGLAGGALLGVANPKAWIAI